jgi:hypothetical protein
MQDIIADASKSRFTIGEDDEKKEGILVTDAWMQELMKHPYHSSKQSFLTIVEKPGTGIFLMKERAKLVKVQKNRTVHTLSKRLTSEEAGAKKDSEDKLIPEKRVNTGKPNTEMMSISQSSTYQKK